VFSLSLPKRVCARLNVDATHEVSCLNTCGETQAGYLRNMPTGIGRLAQVLSSKCSRRYVKYEAQRDTLEDEGAPFGADGAGFCRGFRITDETNACSTIARIRHQTLKISLGESASYVLHSTMNVVQANV